MCITCDLFNLKQLSLLRLRYSHSRSSVRSRSIAHVEVEPLFEPAIANLKSLTNKQNSNFF